MSATAGTGRPITVAFTLIGRGNWTGGETYLRNMLGMVREELTGEVAPKLFLSPEQALKLRGSLDPFLAAPPVIDAMFSAKERNKRVLRSLTIGRDAGAEELFRSHGADVVFESAQFYGRRFGLPVVSWIPDFQHRHLPHLFTKPQWWRRDLGFRAQTSSNRGIMLSSENAKADCETFYPRSCGKTSVVRFAIDFDPARHIARQAEMIATYKLPQRFFYLPNQFWKHKNHALVVDALALLKADGRLADIPPIILTGRTDDPRNPTHFAGIMQRVETLGVTSHFRYLGLIPYEDVFGLAGSCDALINPSLFEGWSTTVEEAKGLGCRMLLSDIAIHLEQAPAARFFTSNDAASLAVALAGLAALPTHDRPPVGDLLQAQKTRREAYASALLQTLNDAVRRGAPARA